ncbi:MAG: hypothetical protein IJG87_06145 [Ruminococcus sp.]|nr:hypothetical protein [Ruminococcus sp.]
MKNYIKVYVKVSSDFDTTGYMKPRSITWEDGRVFMIDSVKDFRPASTLKGRHSGDCYTVVIKGKERLLFFEKTSELFESLCGRWYIEKPVA